MSRFLGAALLALALPCANAADVAPDAAPQAAPAAAPSPVDAVRQASRGDKRGLVERNMQLTDAQAKVFWPIYDDYQKKLERIVRRQNRAVLDYVNAESTMTDANAKRIAREILAADADEQKLRERTFRQLSAKLPARKAVRYLQIENKIRTIDRYDIAERMALVR
jgi:Spy/CpxP family protein refolding chaperone